MKKAATKNVGKSIDAIMEFVDVDGVVSLESSLVLIALGWFLIYGSIVTQVSP